MPTIRALGLAVIVFALLSATGAEATPPVPPDRQTRLEALEHTLENRKQQKEDLQDRAASLKKDMDQTRQHMVTVSRYVQRHEQVLQNLETRIDSLKIEQVQIQDRLEGDRATIAQLTLALQRLRRVPPEALIIRPGAPYKAAQSAMLMGDIIPLIYQQAETLKNNLQDLETITTDLEDKKNKAHREAARLKTEQAQLAELMQRREALYKATRQGLKEEEAHIKRIAHQAASLQDLIARLDQDERRAAARAQTHRAVMRRPDTARPAPKDGRAQLPLSGIIRISYNQPDAFGAASRGLSIEGRSKALVVAPMAGTIRFAGPFKNYGRMVIIEHAEKYHSLIAGLQKIDTVVGAQVKTGEPLGFLPEEAGDAGGPRLYYELRLNGQPVDPARKFIDLRS